jgi:hypothetical protein
VGKEADTRTNCVCVCVFLKTDEDRLCVREGRVICVRDRQAGRWSVRERERERDEVCDRAEKEREIKRVEGR